MIIDTFQMDSSLGSWTHSSWKPGAADPLAGSIDQIWHFDGATSLPRERVFPNGLLEIIVHLDDRYWTLDETGFTLSPTTCITGLYSKAFVIEAPGRRCRVLGLRLKPAGAWALLRSPLSDLSERTVDLCDLIGREASELAERCHDATTAAERIRRTAEWASGRIQRSREIGDVNGAIAWAAACIASSDGATPIARLREQTGLSSVRMAAAFREQVGMTPKRFARIHRLQRALALLHSGSLPLAQIALDSGYYDQPHMNAEFREMTGLTPREFLATQRYPNSVSLPESA
jgi:AraC-like DNA-binding protein